MDPKVLKRFIKQAVKEAIQEELKDVLLEAVKVPKHIPIGVGGYGVPNTLAESIQTTHNTVNTGKQQGNVRERYASLLNNMMEARNGNLSLNSSDALFFGGSQEYKPPSTVNTTAEGSALPSGEVNLNQIANLLGKK